VLNDDNLKLTFLPQVRRKGTEEAALKAFAVENKETALKTRPKVCKSHYRRFS
jgi:predicted metal-dependent phosphotriesterase family hydrolase